MKRKGPPRDGLTIFVTGSEPVCSGCETRVAKPGWVLPQPDRRPLCLACGGVGHLVFLPTGDATLLRRAAAASAQSLVVLQRKGRPNRLMKLGLLVDADALAAVRAACLADADARQRRRERDRLRRVDSATRRQRLIRDRARRAELDAVYVANFAARIRALYPAAPEGVETRIAKHACLKHSRRVGRSAAAKAFDDRMIRLAVVASIRHERTEYDALLKEGVGRVKARKRVKRMIDAMLEAWSARP